MKMDYIVFFLFLVSIAAAAHAQHEDIPYQNVNNICGTCECIALGKMHTHYSLNCTSRNFQHILARWPVEFGNNHTDLDIVALFSNNSIEILQQLPATNASLTFACQNCGIKHLQAPTFMDVPFIKRVDLSWNALTDEELTPDVFRGPFRATSYEPIALYELDLSHNSLRSLHKKLFEHTPNITVLNLSHNPLKVLDNSLMMGVTSAKNLKVLDISYTGLKSLPAAMFIALSNLKTLNLAGNELTTVPENLQFIGHSLTTLNLAANAMTQFDEKSFKGLQALKRLNISDMPALRTIENATFSHLDALEYLYCANNRKLANFDMKGLLPCTKLSYLDISNCAITTLSVDLDLSFISYTNITNSTLNVTTVTPGPVLPTPWPQLRVFETVGNPWLCDCALLQTLEFAGAQHRYKDTETRCEGPYLFAGLRLSNITATQICAMHLVKKFHAVDEDPPRFLRKDYIILTAIIASVVIVLGLIIGFVVVCIRRRLKRDDFGVEPIRYTSVRSSNLSAFSHAVTNGNTNAA